MDESNFAWNAPCRRENIWRRKMNLEVFQGLQSVLSSNTCDERKDERTYYSKQMKVLTILPLNSFHIILSRIPSTTLLFTIYHTCQQTASSLTENSPTNPCLLTRYMNFINLFGSFQIMNAWDNFIDVIFHTSFVVLTISLASRYFSKQWQKIVKI